MSPLVLAADIDEEMKDSFVELILEGFKPNRAAELIGTTGTQMRKHYSGNSDLYYDPDFAERVTNALVSEEHATAFLERIRGKVSELALEDGNVRLLEKLSLIYDPAWEVLRNPNLNVNVNVLLKQAAPGLPREQLEQLREALLEAQKRKELESGDVIEHKAA